MDISLGNDIRSNQLINEFRGLKDLEMAYSLMENSALGDKIQYCF
jgi:hypothetical protein